MYDEYQFYGTELTALIGNMLDLRETISRCCELISDHPAFQKNESIRRWNVLADRIEDEKGSEEKDPKNTSAFSGDFSGFVTKAVGLSESIDKTTESIGKATGHLSTFQKVIGGVSVAANNVPRILNILPTIDTNEDSSGLLKRLTGLVDIGFGVVDIYGKYGWTGLIPEVGALIMAGNIWEQSYDKALKRKMKQDVEDARKNLMTFEMSGNEADSYVKTIHKWAQKPQESWRFSYDPVKENVKLFGSGAYDLSTQLPYQVADQLNIRSNVPPHLAERQPDHFVVEKSYMERTFDIQQQLRNAAYNGGRERFDEKVLQLVTKAKSYDNAHHTNTIKETEAAVKESLYYVLHGANDHKTLFDVNPIRDAGATRQETARQGGSAKISININRPLIGSFSINVKNGSDGLKDFKQKVEEVLLEILNEANTIR